MKKFSNFSIIHDFGTCVSSLFDYKKILPNKCESCIREINKNVYLIPDSKWTFATCHSVLSSLSLIDTHSCNYERKGNNNYALKALILTDWLLNYGHKKLLYSLFNNAETVNEPKRHSAHGFLSLPAGFKTSIRI